MTDAERRGRVRELAYLAASVDRESERVADERTELDGRRHRASHDVADRKRELMHATAAANGLDRDFAEATAHLDALRAALRENHAEQRLLDRGTGDDA